MTCQFALSPQPKKEKKKLSIFPSLPFLRHWILINSMLKSIIFTVFCTLLKLVDVLEILPYWIMFCTSCRAGGREFLTHASEVSSQLEVTINAHTYVLCKYYIPRLNAVLLDTTLSFIFTFLFEYSWYRFLTFTRRASAEEHAMK